MSCGQLLLATEAFPTTGVSWRLPSPVESPGSRDGWSDAGGFEWFLGFSFNSRPSQQFAFRKAEETGVSKVSMSPSDAAEGARRIQTVRNVHTGIHIQCVYRNITLLNQPKIAKDGFENGGGLHKLPWGLVNLVVWRGSFCFPFMGWAFVLCRAQS